MSVFVAAAVLVMAVITVILNHISHKEYSEEIERLRTDLTSRNKDEVQVSEENYKHIISQLEGKNTEMSQRLTSMESLYEELERKEKIYRTLYINLKLQTETNVEKGTFKTLCDTKLSTNGERQKTSEPEKPMSDQAKILYAREDTFSREDHPYDRLSRKRSIDTVNEERRQSFHADFSNKIAQMDMSINSFLQNYQSFTLQFQNRLGEHSNDIVSSLSSLSENMSSLVDDQCNTVSDLEKALSDQVAGGLQLIRRQLETCRSTSNIEIGKLHTFLTVTFAEAIQKIGRNSQIQKTVNDALYNSLALFKQNFDTLQQQMTEFSDTLDVLRVEFQKNAEEELKRKEKIQHFIDKLEEQKEKDDKERILKLKELEAFLQQALNYIRLATKSSNNEKHDIIETSTSLKRQIAEELELKKQFKEKFSNKINICEDKVKQLHQNYKNNINDLVSNVQNSVEQFQEHTVHMDRDISNLETDIQDIVESEKSIWQEFYLWNEQEYRKQREYYNTGLQENFEHTRSLTSRLHQAAINQESVLESGKNELATFVHESLSDLETQCLNIEEWGQNIGSEVRQRDHEVENLLFEHMNRNDQAETGYQRNFLYSQNIQRTSPRSTTTKYKLTDSKKEKENVIPILSSPGHSTANSPTNSLEVSVSVKDDVLNMSSYKHSGQMFLSQEVNNSNQTKIKVPNRSISNKPKNDKENKKKLSYPRRSKKSEVKNISDRNSRKILAGQN